MPAGTASDNLDTVVAELWSTGSTAKKISIDDADAHQQPGRHRRTAWRTHYAETPVDVSGLVSGAYELHLTATTVSGAKGTAVRGFRADSGPTIVITKPADRQPPYKGSIAAQVTISDAIFAPISEREDVDRQPRPDAERTGRDARPTSGPR